MRSLTFTFGLLTVLCACAGTETDNPVLDFDKSNCKSHGLALSVDPGVARTRAMLDVDDSIYDGLYRYAWETTASGALTLDVINYSGGCSVDWAFESADLDGHKLSLAVINDRCSVAACGSCIYDFTF